MSRIKPLTRNQLAQFLPTPEAVKAFEKVMSQALELLPDDIVSINARIDDSNTDAAQAYDTAMAAMAIISVIEHALSVIASMPNPMPQLDQDDIDPVYCLGSLASQNSDRLQLTGTIEAPKTITAGGTTGAQTINKISGSVNFAAAATSLVVTNSLVSASSVILCTVATNDLTFKSANAVAGAGSFTINANAAATAETRVNFFVLN